MGTIPVGPGVFSTITDLSTFVEAIPSTIGFMAFVSDQGEDNVMKFNGSREQFLKRYGTPNYDRYGNFAEGLLTADEFMKESPSMYSIRVLPTDATYAHLSLTYQNSTQAGEVNYGIGRINNNPSSLQSINTFITNACGFGSGGSVNDVPYVVDGYGSGAGGGLGGGSAIDTTTTPNTVYPGYGLWTFYPIGRGEYYNDIKIKLTKVENKDWIYTIDIYLANNEGEFELKESFEVTFRQDIKDDMGDSLFIEEVLAKYSDYLRCEVNDEYTFDRFNSIIKNDIINAAPAYMHSVNGVMLDAAPDNPNDGDTYYVSNRIMGDQYDNIGKVMQWNAGTSTWTDTGDTVNYGDLIKTDNNDLYIVLGNGYITEFDAFAYPFLVPLGAGDDINSRILIGGSSGSLLDVNGYIDNNVATQLLVQAYTGLIDRNVIDRDNYYFSIVYDAGYPYDVKVAISELTKSLRRDCVGIISNGRTARNIEDEIKTRRVTNTFNTYFVALYCVGTKIYDEHSGTKKWVNPTYHMASVIPFNDKVGGIFRAPAGYNRASIDGIHEMMYNPIIQNDIDQLYLNQLNPIVLSDGVHLVYGELTSQRRPSALQSLKIVRTVLYIDTALRKYCKYYLWEDNDELTWSQVRRDVVEFLETVKSDRGLYDYSVEVSATEYEIKRSMFHVNVILRPTRAVYRIMLNFFIK